MTTHQAAHVAVLEAMLVRSHDSLRMAQGLAEEAGPRAQIAALHAAIAAMKQQKAALAETPMVDGPLGKTPAYRMDAYYYGFAHTGVDAIDKILSAVACAGKAFHDTEDWTSEGLPREHVRGKSPVDWIWNAAADAAEQMRALAAPTEANR